MSRLKGPGRPAIYDWHLLNKPGDTILVRGKTAPMMTPIAAKASRRMGGAILRCITVEEGCYILLVGFRDDDEVVVKKSVEVSTAKFKPKAILMVEEPDEDPDADIRQYLIDDDDD